MSTAEHPKHHADVLGRVERRVRCTCLGVTAASRIYRVAILYQGNTPKLAEMASWIVKDPAK